MKSRNVEDVYPLSPAQEGILFHSLYEPESGFYVKQMSCPLHGPVDLAALERAWRRVVERHTILRTSFVWKKQNRPLQVVHREVSVPFAVHDWRGQPGHWEAFLKEDLKQGFDASRPPLMRLALARTDEETHQLLWTAHHLLLDGWSLPLVLGEVFQLYTAFQAGRDVALPPPRPYGDFVAWLQRQDLARAEAFWKERLRGFPAPTPLPGRWASNGHGAGPLGVRRARLGAEATAALQSLAQRHRLTLNTLVQGAWGILLGRYADQPDVVFGIAVSGRPAELPDAGAMVGPFLNTVPFRLTAAGDEPLLPWLAGLQRQVLETQAYEHSPLVLVQGWSEVPRGTALFESLLVFENYPAEAVPAQGNGALRIGGLSTLERTNYPLTLSVVPGEELAFRLAWDAGRFDGESAGRLLEHLLRILEGMASAARLADLPLPVGDEAVWNESAMEVPAVCAHALVKRRAALHPGAPAVLHAGETVSYGELDRRATALARRLRALGVGPESLVGLAVERSPAMLASMLAVWKSGAAYLPLDFAQPRERLAMILEDAPPAVVVTEEAMLGSLPPHGARVLVLDREAGPVSAEPLPAAHPDNLAYVLFTSGSTGRPKGVQISHRALVNFLVSMREEPGLRETDVLLAVTTLSFDIAALELILPLTVGAQVAIAGREEAADGARLLERLSGATVLQATPATWRMLLAAGWSGDAGLRAFCGGEALPAPLAARLLPRVAELWNLYGPTETTVWSAVRRVGPGEDEPASVAIGRPVANTRLHLLGRDGRPVPLEAAGELWIGGAGLARGYRGLPALTADRFRPDPFSEAGGRRYRTGDLARRLPDGRIEFLGRLDHQVKIRGFRIELGEIESALARHPAVAQSAVLARTDGGSDPRLVGYLVPRPGEAPKPEELRAFLRGRLPEPMLPTAFVTLESFPLTPSGKLDRKALPAPEAAGAPCGYLAPGNPLEEMVANAWEEVLEVERVGVDDDFFALGGHSLLAARIVSRLGRALGEPPPVRWLFERPTVRGLAARIAGERGRGALSEAPPIVPVPRREDVELPLSFSQQRLWFLDRLEPGSGGYNVPSVLRLQGRLDLPALAAALAAIVRRHEVLRTIFPEVDGRPRQAIEPPPAVLAPPVVDLAGLPAAARERELARQTRAEVRRPFDLARGPLLRTLLFRLDESEHVLALTAHHIVCDAWSYAVFLRELSALYAGGAQSLPALPFQYADFAAWQRGWLRGEAMERRVEAWRSRLAGAPAGIELPTDRPYPPVQTFRGGSVPFRIEDATAAGLRTLARAEGATLFMTLLAGFQALLHRYSGQDDVVVGSPIHGRTRPELEELIGVFINTLALRGNLAGDPGFRELLARSRETALDAFALQDLPFERLIEELQPPRDLARPPLFQVMLILQNAPAAALDLPGLAMSPLPADTGTAKLELLLTLGETGGTLGGSLEFNSDLFDRSTAERLVEHLAILLAGAVADPSQRLSDLPLLTPGELDQVLHTWNDTAAAFPELPVHRLFEQQAGISPEALALAATDERLTYADLNQRADRLARRLRRMGVGPEVLVGVSLERSAGLVAALLGILKAGGAYLPLDPTYPAERLRTILEDARPAVLLTSLELGAGLFAEVPGPTRVVCPEDLEAIASEGAAPDAGVGPDNLAYVLFTSGSTGQPKGVAVPHRGLANFLAAMRREPGIEAGERLLAVTSLSFDIAALEIYLPLLAGGCVELATREQAGDGAWLAARLAPEASPRIRVLQATPSTWRMLLGAGWQGDLDLKALCGGEALPPDLAAALRGRVGELWNLYGPTETTVWSSASLLARGDAGPVTVGRAIANTRIYLLDPSLRPVPRGAAGHLHIGGVGLARGYLGLPALTADRFRPDPFGGSGERLYRTGDLARHRPDGRIEVLGRLDHQVKIRGFRIELGEIEATLASHPGVREAVVVARETTPGDRSLVAYVTGIEAPGMALRAFLRERLPDSMVPSRFVALEAMPLTPNGKIDRRALPAPDEAAEGCGGAAPRDPVEEIVAGLWREVLGRDAIGIHDDFFELGGHSLTATQLASKLWQAFGVELPVRRLFEAPTVARLAEAVRAARRSGVEEPPPPIVSIPRDGELPLSFSQLREWFLDQLEPGSPAFDVPRSLRLRGRLQVAAALLALDEIVRRHESLRTTFPARGGRPVQVIVPALDLDWPLVDLGGLPEAARQIEARRLAREHAAHSFDLARGPLLRATFLCAGEEEHLLLINLHHIVADDWSVGVLVGELGTLYSQIVSGRPASLPPLPVQYADFAAWQRARLQGSALEAQLSYWRRQLEGDRPPLALPADRPRPARPSFRGAGVPVVLPAQVAELAAGAGASAFMAVLAAFQAQLHRWTGERDVSVGTFMANRDRAEVEPLIGFFVNTLVLRSRPEPGMPFVDFLKAVRETCLDAYANRDVPFERLLEELQPERRPGHAPFFQVMLVLQNAPAPALELPGLEMETLHVETARSDFDLTLWLSQDREGRLAGALHYATDLFHRTTALRMVKQLQRLIAGAAADPGRTLRDLPFLGEAERHQVLLGWNDTAVTGDPPEPVHRLVSAVARRTPEGVAIVAGTESLTYGELEARSNRLARRLRRLGVGPESRVALCVERSLDMVVGLLAVLKSGGAYVPLDPAYPQERRELLLADSGAAVVLGQGLIEAAAEEGSAPEDLTSPESLAYVIYTSGSTGRPKGVLVPHRALAAHTRAAVAHHGIRPGDRVLQFASISFDASAEEIYPCLAAGATLVLRDELMLGSPARFAEACRELGITVLDLPTAYWHELAGIRLPESVRLVILGGEKALADRWAQWQESGPTARLANTYGPTEATIVATLAELGEPDGEAPIGRPIAGVRAYVLDAGGLPQAMGVPGELCLGGAGVARGYLGDPAATAARFVPDPFGAGTRLYRTGDLVRWRGDGELEFLGRLDAQVKIRGFRVEPGEIEAALAAHPGVREVAVVARESRLVAYAVPGDMAPSPRELRSWLEARLPRHLIPSTFVLLESLPRTAAGKIDRRGLPVPEVEEGEHTPAATPTEEMLATIWAEVLGVERVGVRDNFFDLGGHSLVATQIVARIQELFQVDLPLRALFEAPTVERLALRVEEAGRREVPPLRRVPRDRDLPLSFSQERIWFLSRLDPESTSYFVPRALRLAGRLDVAALERAYAALLERHEVLRTTFPEVDGRPVQRIHPPGPFRLPLVDLRGLPDGPRQREEERLILEDGARLFDVEAGPLIRASLLQVAEEEWVAVQTEHHLVHDGWTEAVLLRDLLGLYQASAEGREPDLPELPVQFADFAVWQREWLRGEVLEVQLAWWWERLAGAPPLLELPADRPRPPRPSFRGEAEDVLIPRERVRQLRALGRREGATLFMTVLAAFETLLLRLSGQEDLVVGTGVANRRQRETEGMLGMVINTLALRADASGDPPFAELLRRVRETCLGAYAHQDLPFDRLVEALKPERTPSHAPVFQVLFAFHDARFPEVSLPGLDVRSVMRHNRSAKFDLVLILTPYDDTPGDDSPAAGALGIHAEYSTDLFDGATVRRFLGGLQNLLAGAVARPGARLSDLPLLTAAERDQILIEWNDTARGYPSELTIHGLFEDIATSRPDAVALVSGDRETTYGELNALADLLAVRLRSHGVGPEVPVAILAERSPEMVVALLATLKTGGLYMPLAANQPMERLAWLLADAAPRVVLVQEGLEARLAALPAGIQPLPLVGEQRRPAVGVTGSGALPAETGPDNLAYILYTSGSTGRPKGVVVPHRAVVRLVRGTGYADFSPERVWGQLAPVPFDASTLEIWGPLLNGAKLVIFPAGPISIAELGAVVARHGIDSLWLTAGLFHQVVEEEPGALRPLRQLLAGGDVLSPEHVRKALAENPGLRLVNGYGPTENTTFTCCHGLSDPGEVGWTVPLGPPIANTRVYILDGDRQPVPVGVAGELCTGGDGLARGYLGCPDLTAERFVPDSYGAPGSRTYRTGDRVRFRPDGTVEFLGRMDRQVKLRGFRIEPAEIEAVLATHPHVSSCAVVVREGRPGDRWLVAYWTAREDAGEAGLAAFLRERLPEYMVPSAFVLLDDLPLTRNGKVDRGALPAPGLPSRASVAPRTACEELLGRLWSDLLGCAQVGVDDDFFELGGHSLLVTQLVSRIRATFGVELPLKAVFESPTLGGLADSVEQAMRSRAIPASPPILPRRRTPEGEASLPLSFAQQRLWFLEQLEPGSAFYNIPAAIRIRGPLEVAPFMAALQEIVRRHESLRTRFVEREGLPIQAISPSLALPVPVADLRALPEPQREETLRGLATDDARRPFDLVRGPLIRILFLQSAPDEHVLLINQHHIVSDGWSTGVLARELMALYRAFSTANPSPLPPLPVQYADFALWQRDWLQGNVLAEQLDFWRARLQGVTGLELPLDRPRPPMETFRGSYHSFPLSRDLSERLHGLARSRGVTLFMVLLASFKALLLRVTGQSDIPVGSPIANRNRREVEDLIGFFANTLVLRAGLDAGTPFEELLVRVREVTLGGYAHQELPFERLVEELQPERDMSRNPLFQVMCVLQNQPFPSVDEGGVTWSRIPIDSGTAKFDLTLFWYEDDGRISGALEYNTDLFDPSTALRLVRYQESLLQAAVEGPGSSLNGLPLLDEAQRHQLLVEWNATGAEEAELACVHRWVEAQVERTPDAVALLYRGCSLTYREVNVRANRLAHLLHRRGVGPESLVGICVERSVSMVVALLAVLKAGGAGVALDPAYPHERLATIIADAGMRVLLTQESLLAHFPGSEAIALCLDAEEELCAGESDGNPDSGIDLDNPIYAIYTSGSTGQPKGIVVTHRAFSNLLDWQLARSSLAGRARTVQFATFGFCVSFQEIFSAWCSGAALVLADEMTRRDMAGLSTFLEEEGIERLHLPFAALKHLAEAAAARDRLPACLREVVTAGEQLQVNPAVRRLFAHLPGCSLHNQYGASETHVVTALTLAGDPGGWPAIPSVGQPISNVRIHLLDSALASVPIGVPGELYAGGDCVARGYLNDPVLTAQKMVPDPFSPVPGARLYRTGDSARYLADGSIEYHGRIDTQVKIRGFRVELGEIDTVLASHPAVRDAAVVAQSLRTGDRRLVAYVVLDDPRTGVLDDLRTLLKSRLPEYMLPSAYVVLDVLPLNANGKLDQAALPVPEPERTAEGAATAPRTVVEEVLAGIWAEVLEAPPGSIGLDDSFFELGGHSLLATRVASRLRDAFKVELPLRELFESPTIARLAIRIEEERRSARRLQAPPFRKAAPGGEAPLSFAQQRLWFLDQLEPGSPVYHVPFALGVSGPLDLDVLERALGEVVRRHETLRTAFLLREGEPVQVVHPFAGLPIRRIDLSGLPAETRDREASRLAAAEARAPFSLATGSLLRVSTLRLAPDEHVILLTLHHIVCDEWSLGVLVRELSVLHAAFSEGRPSPLPDLPFQYVDFSEWQRLWLSGGTLDVHLGYWRSRLVGAPLLELPADRPRPPVLTLRGRVQPMSLPAGLSAELRALAQGSGATLFMTLLTAFKTLLHRHSGQTDLVVGTDVANRNRRETEGMIGFFVNQLVLRAQLGSGTTFRELLRQVKEVVLEAHLHQDLPFAKLVEELRIERDLSRNPLFQTAFALHLPDGAPDFRGLSLRPWSLPADSAKFDLTLAFTDLPEGLAGGFEYSTDLFDASTLGRMAAHLEVLLQGIAADPGRRLTDLPLVAEAERHQLLAEWNDSATSAPETAFPELFEAQAARTPERTAVVCGRESVTYRELDERAGRAAGFLAGQGVGPDTVVALLAERGIDFLVAVLAVFKAGGAYLPLDPYHPPARHARILERSGCRLVLAQAGFLPALETAGGVRLIDLGKVARADRPPVSGRQLPAHLAYVIYTSGSTGEPKGVMIEQRGMVNHLRAKLSALNLGPDDAVAQNASQCFDISVWQLLAALMVGGRVHVVPDETALDAAGLLRLLERERITVFETVPSMLRALLDRLETQPADLARLRWLIPTGEALPPDLCRRWLALFPRVPLLNAYGPTECSDDVTHHEVSRAPEGATVPIGRPVLNLGIHLLDREGSPVPAGVAGELFVGGAGLGRGYLGDPALTAVAFVPDPVTGEPGARLYRSGDLARRLGDGTLEFLGRIDHQVKVRGFRIELGEVEAALARHAEVREAVVVARDERSGDRRLVAYVVPRTGEADAAREMSQWQAVFDETYGADAFSKRDPRLNLKLWTSSYTGRSFDEDEIFECVDDSAARILALKPRRVLEIGCGTGLLLFRITPRCEAYWGTDFSPAVLGFLKNQIDTSGVEMPEVRLLERRADDLSGIPEGAFDTVILNEVSQYFPGADYLVKVLEAACRAVRPGGTVFVGGVRSLALLEAFHASVELERASPFLTVEELRERTRRRLARDKELAVAPELFAALARRLPRISGAEVRLKGGRHRNELVKFRYDVVLRVDGEARPGVRVPASDWRRDGWSLDAVRRHLIEEAPEALAVGGIPNARVAFDAALVEALAERSGHAADLREAVRALIENDGVDPQDLLDLDLPYDVEVGWTRSTADGSFDALFRRRGADFPALATLAPMPQSADRPWAEYANSPLQGYLGGELAARLREDLAASLPDYMVPAAVVVLDALPLTANGKVDRKALPEPDRERPELRESYVAPRDEVEERLAGIWREILGVDRVGVRDSFFDLGGHSLLATQVLSRVRDAFHREISLREIFDQPTVAHLAGLIKVSGGEPQPAEAPRLERAARDRYRTRRKALDESA